MSARRLSERPRRDLSFTVCSLNRDSDLRPVSRAMLMIFASVSDSFIHLMRGRKSAFAERDGRLIPLGPFHHNRTVARQVDDFARFINLHYAGGRTDTDFWRAMTASGIPAAQRERVAAWRERALTRTDFTPLPGGLPHVEEQLYMPVLDGLGLCSGKPSKAVMSSAEARRTARQATTRLTSEFVAAARRAVGHRAFLASVGGTGD